MTEPASPFPPTEAGPGPSMLLVDDDETFRERLARSFRARGFEVRTAGSLDEAERMAGEESPEYAVVDLRMPGSSGIEVLKALKSIDPQTKVLVLTGYGSMATAVEVVKLGAENIIPKPADADEILAAFEKGGRPGTAVTQRYQAPSLARIEWEHIQRVLTDCGGNISEAARRLGIHRRSLQRKLQKYAPRT